MEAQYMVTANVNNKHCYLGQDTYTHTSFDTGLPCWHKWRERGDIFHSVEEAKTAIQDLYDWAFKYEPKLDRSTVRIIRIAEENVYACNENDMPALSGRSNK